MIKCITFVLLFDGSVSRCHMPTQKPRLTVTFDEWLDKEIESAAKQGGYKSKSSYIVAIVCRELCPDRVHEIGS